MSKIALCFLLYDRFENIKIWNTWLRNRQDKFNVYIHNVSNIIENLEIKYVKIPTVETGYGKIGLVNATILLFEEAFKDPENFKFVLLSGTCIPVKNFSYVYDFLTKDETSYICYFKGGAFPRYNSLKKYYNEEHIWKHSQWIILNRFYAQYFIENRLDICEKFKNVDIPDETVFATELSYKFNNKNIINIDTTYCNWSKGLLANYKIISSKEMDNILNSHRLFSRKFRERCLVDAHQSLYYYLKIKGIFV
jgi:hypothetical protein